MRINLEALFFILNMVMKIRLFNQERNVRQHPEKTNKKACHRIRHNTDCLSIETRNQIINIFMQHILNIRRR